MKKYQYVVALACVLVGAAGFTGIYVTNQAEEREAELAKQEQILQENQKLELASKDKPDTAEEEKPEAVEFVSNKNTDTNLEPKIDGVTETLEDALNEEKTGKQEKSKEQTKEDQNKETVVGTIVEEKLSFQPEKGVVWPIEGSVLLDYSMESTIFFPTLQQYQYNPAMVISANVNDKVYFIARGKITNIETNEVTGCTVTQDIGDGYTAIYGQLKELNFDAGEMVESGQVVGYVSEPTKYYSAEGSNVYFQLLKDGVPVDPEEILP